MVQAGALHPADLVWSCMSPCDVWTSGKITHPLPLYVWACSSCQMEKSAIIFGIQDDESHIFLVICCIEVSGWICVNRKDRRIELIYCRAHVGSSFKWSGIEAAQNNTWWKGLIVTAVVQQSHKHTTFLWSPYGIRQTIIFSCCSLFFLLFFPRLISAAADWMSARLPHMVWPWCECRMQVSRLGSITAQQWSSDRQPNFASLNRGRGATT